MALKSFSGMFGRTHAAVIGMIHVGALPGTPRNKQKISEITEAACKEAEIYKEAGVDGIIVENMHDIPYMHTDSVGHEITASMSVICSHIKGICPNIPCGVQILAGANKQALSVAQAADLNCQVSLSPQASSPFIAVINSRNPNIQSVVMETVMDNQQAKFYQ
uniref:Uncharacterized protein F13E9.13, mitochondrial-like n=1 Tax=Saccoglossus kowalevskii TaxID=10224 RepID=A0ABM0MAW4_SACKO|nr:PREDICTED: uncharacterized protein F13E9.13, mitochondrial-like [Saccoglossus kowalevskii]